MVGMDDIRLYNSVDKYRPCIAIRTKKIKYKYNKLRVNVNNY